MEIKCEQKRTWAEINIDNIINNYPKVEGCKVCCVIKANAYGHGAIELAKVYEEIGADYFAVSNIEEAIQLRKAKITTPIMILGYTPVECAKQLSEYNIEQAVYDLDFAKQLNDECKLSGVRVDIHLKLDTGMGRIGFQCHNGHNEIEDALEACTLSNLTPVGVFTHFANADEGINDLTKTQYKDFINAIACLENKGINFKVKHCANSAAIIDYPEFNLDMVRAGISLYGINPSPITKTTLKQALSLWSVVSKVKTVHKGDRISYGGEFVADKEIKVATIPIGYADGFWRSNKGNRVYINGEYCKILGRVCMDQIMVECNNAKMGDVVEIYGEHVTIDEVAKYNKTIPYEILCAIGERVPRVYRRDNKIIKIVDKIDG